ncbi:DUF485 domain-containing protein [Streptomyces mirabilis]|uniref:DUF485 domain-containing protein n=1 Tax=Streptomyces mirabilis TaxID=68239 RepID=UPI003669D8F8
MHEYFTQADPFSVSFSPDDGKTLQRGADLVKAVHRAEFVFVVVNGVPFVFGIAAAFTDIFSTHVYGQFTLGLLWGIAQCVLFVATALLYESRCTRSCDPIEQSIDESGW